MSAWSSAKLQVELMGTANGNLRSPCLTTGAARPANLDPKIIALVDTAFDKSWQFVRTDPELAHRDVREMRASLTESLTRLAQNGERDVWRLANGAIGQLRRQRSAA